MPRRRSSPPTALRLVTGPAPPRGYPRHLLPSLPQPVFHPSPASTSSFRAAPTSRSRHGSVDHAQAPTPASIPLPQLDDLVHALEMSMYASPAHNASSTSLGGSYGSRSHSPSNSISGSPKGPSLRAPWNHSGCIPLPFDTTNMLKAPEPVATSPGAGR
ncbi:hypothetical protein HGRIS_013421 [Hohenbuehelia grisea]|uniref:Uncharacterized protein n=1 Tax=Hohenbuehelia grisea TaxID=104357 RepID=A0ABR3IVJ1_9AGAR